MPESLKVKVAYMFLRGEPVVWIEHVAQLRMYRWNKSRPLLQRSFRSLGADWDIRTVNELWNSTYDSSKGGLGRCESTGPSNAPGRDARGDGSDSNDKDGPEENLERETEGTKTQRKV